MILARLVLAAAAWLDRRPAAVAGGVVIAALAVAGLAIMVNRLGFQSADAEVPLMDWVRAMFCDIFLNFAQDPAVSKRGADAGVHFRTYVDALIADLKAGGRLQDDVIGRLIAMQADPVTALSDERIATNLIGLLVGFVPTVATATTLAIDKLLDLPDALATAQGAARVDDDDAVRAHMWEAMRLAPQSCDARSELPQ